MHFDREIEDYELTVCSAGLDNPFMVEQQKLSQTHLAKTIDPVISPNT